MGAGTHRLTGRRALLLAAIALVVWGIAVLLTGGFVLEAPWGRISSRAAVRPLLAGALLLLFYVTRWRHHSGEDIGPLARIPLSTAIASAATGMALVIAFGWGARIAGGPDASGYVSEAAMFARGELTLRTPEWARSATWQDAPLSTAPIGYRPTADPFVLAPIYSPGLPLLMALFQVIAGPGAALWVVPLLAGVTVWSTYRLGKALHGAWTGAIAAVLMASSPTFLIMSVQAMSDVPVTAFWTLSLVAAVRSHGLGAGLAAGLAIVTRPNLVLLAAVPAALLLVSPGSRVRRLAIFALSVAPGAAIVGFLNWYYYGSPLRSGYGSFEYLYSLDRVLPNLRQYAGWFNESQTLLPLLGVLAPVAARAGGHDRATQLLVCAAFPVAVLMLYLPYLVFHPNEWGYLRFLLPGYPGLMVGFGVVVVTLTRRAPSRIVGEVAGALTIAVLVVHAWQYAVRNSVFRFQETDRRYVRAVAYARRLPPRSVFISLAHSGTLRHYTERDVLRFEVVAPEDIDTALAYLEARGYGVYLVGDAFEIDMFRERFAGSTAAARLAQAPHRDLGGSVAYALSATGSGRR